MPCRCYRKRIRKRRRIRCADGSRAWSSSWMGRRGGRWRAGCAARRRPWAGRDGRGPCSCWRTGRASRLWRRPSGWPSAMCAHGREASSRGALRDSTTRRGPAGRRLSPPEVVLHVVKAACARPDAQDRSLAQWDGVALARQMVATGVVDGISPNSLRYETAKRPSSPKPLSIAITETVVAVGSARARARRARFIRRNHK